MIPKPACGGLLRAAAVSTVLTLAACATTPPQTGIMSGQHRHPGVERVDRVTLSWRRTGRSQGTMRMTLPPGTSGEGFRGQYVRISERASAEALDPVIAGWGPVWRDPDWGVGADPWLHNRADFQLLARRFQGEVLATLYGNLGHTARCRFQPKDPRQGLVSGGGGRCELSTGAEVSFTF